MRWRKALATLSLTAAVVVSTVAFGFSFADQQKESAIVFGLHGLFTLYLVLTAGRSVFQSTRPEHWRSILYLTFLTTCAAIALFIAAVLPDSQPVLLLAIDDVNLLMNLWYTLVVLYAVSSAIFFTTPLGPKLHYPASAIYSEKVVQTITNMDENNVCGVIGIYFLTFVSPPYHHQRF